MSYIQRGLLVEAWQWRGTLDDAPPYWLRSLALQTAGDSLLTLPVGRAGTGMALPGDWIIRLPDAGLLVLSAVNFAALYALAPDSLGALRVPDDEA